jgi:ataxia telangiectasia mutated family protein
MVCQTITSIIIVDPIYRTATPGKLRRMQDEEASVSSVSEEEDDSFLTPEPSVSGAERAIDSVVAKLDTSLSVEYMVNELILEARDPDNLARIFYGKSSPCRFLQL